MLETNLQPIVTDIDPDNSNENTAELAEEPNNSNVLTDELINITREENIDQTLLDEINIKFLHYFNVYENASLESRNFNTQVIYNIKDEEWKAINHVIDNFIERNSDRITLWLINVMQYAAIITLLDRYNLLKDRKNVVKNIRTPNWQKFLEEKINNIRRKISFITLITTSQNSSTQLTKHQLTIRSKLKRWYGNTKQHTLLSKLSQLKHDLKVTSESLRNKKKLAQRNSINSLFQHNQKQIFRNWKSKKITVEEEPTKDEIQCFWSGIWSKQTSYNKNASWLSTLEQEYCQGTTSKNYVMDCSKFEKTLSKMKNNGAPGNDLIRCYWIKKLTITHKPLVHQFNTVYERNDTLPEWLVTGRTILLPKNNETAQAKNYRPIACQNITYKLFTGIINAFMVDHCTVNNIITPEQAGGKQRSWGCTDQLLINKMILDETNHHRRNLLMMWFDYKKAFDSVPHNWILKALELAHVPMKIINTIKGLMSTWATKLHLTSTETDLIKYLTGVLQGDCMALILFILSVNPLSFMLNKLPGYKAGPPGKRKNKISHLFFVDDLKTYAQDLQEAKLQFDLITTFTKDINMQFGSDKCAYIYIERGKQVPLGKKFSINDDELNQLENGECYKYLGQDEDVGFNEGLNKERVTKEYFKRVRKIWSSELDANNKVTSHNIFAIPVVTPTFGILNWTKEELQSMDIKTRKLLTFTGSFHINSDIDRLYSYRDKGGRGLNSLVDIYISRLVSISSHLKEKSPSNTYLSLVLEHEKESLVRVADQLIECFDIDANTNEPPKKLSLKIKQKMKDNHLETWIKKPQHGYLFRTRKDANQVNESATHLWLKTSSFSSHVEGYISAIQEEEIFTRSLKAKRLPNEQINPNCRLCGNSKETIQHIIAACPNLSASMYLPLRHNKVANVIYQNIVPKGQNKCRQPIREFYSNEYVEIWWDTKVKTLTPLKHNKPDIVLWSKAEKRCFIIDISVGLDVNVTKNFNQKRDNYLPLAAELKRLYETYTFEIIPIAIGATGLVTNSLKLMLKRIGVDNVNDVVLKCQKSALLGTLKIVKSFIKM